MSSLTSVSLWFPSGRVWDEFSGGIRVSSTWSPPLSLTGRREPGVIPALAAMGKEIRKKNGALTREHHLFIQDDYLNYGRHVARREIEVALGFR
jgi:hypothetical protein